MWKYTMELMNLVVLVLSVTGSLAAFGDPCEIVTWSDLSGSNDQVKNITIPKGCYVGDVDWNYPKGSLLLSHTLPLRGFRLCIETGWGTSITKVQEVVNGHYTPLALPTQDKPTCVFANNGVAALLITAPETQLYMTMFKYQLTVVAEGLNIK